MTAHKLYDSKRTVDSKDNSALGGGISLSLEALSTLKLYLDQDLVNQIAELNAKILELEDRDRARKDAFMDQGEELYSVKRENERLYKELERYKSNESNHQAAHFNHHIDERYFKGSNREWQISFWDNMFDLAESTDSNGNYYISDALFIAPIFKCVKNEKITKHPFVGTREDFAYIWNRNITERIENTKRKNKLTCKARSLTAALSQAPWKGSDPTSWTRLANNYDQNHDYFVTACYIKKEISSFSKPIIYE